MLHYTITMLKFLPATSFMLNTIRVQNCKTRGECMNFVDFYYWATMWSVDHHSNNVWILAKSGCSVKNTWLLTISDL